MIGVYGTANMLLRFARFTSQLKIVNKDTLNETEILILLKIYKSKF